MIADAGILVPASRERRKTTLALAGAAFALIVATVSFLADGGGDNAARFAAGMVFRASTAAFLAYYLALPVARLFPSRATADYARERTGLALAFGAVYAVFLGLVVLPGWASGQHLALSTLTFGAFSAVILATLVVAAHRTQLGFADRAVWRTIETLAVVYFWLVFATDDLNRLYGPHRPDNYYGISVLFLVLALFVRFADAFVQRRKAVLAHAAR